MSLPPQPGQWGPGVPPPGPPQPPPGYYPQSGWGAQQPPPTPPSQNNGLKWLLVTVAVLLVIAISVGIALVVTRASSGPTETSTPPTTGAASANDTGPVAVVTSEPTCESWMPASSSMSRIQANGWDDRDPSVPSTAWTIEQRAQHDAVAKSLRQTAEQAVTFARETPNRVIRELYEQFIAYSRAYADSVPTYTSADDPLSLASVAASLALDAVCNSITYGSAAARSSSTSSSDPPSVVADPGDPAAPQMFGSKSDSACSALVQRTNEVTADLAEWVRQDANIPGSRWTPDQKAAEDAAAPIMTAFAADIEAIGRRGENPTLEDLAAFTAVYFRAYVSSLSSYIPADNYLIVVGLRTSNLLLTGCQATTG